MSVCCCRRLLTLLAGLCGLIAFSNAHAAQESRKAPPAEASTNALEMAIQHGPFLQAPSETGITVSWATTKKSVSWVEYREESSQTWLTNHPHAHGLVAADITYHNVPLTGLKPGVTYVYRAVSREILSFKHLVKYGVTVASPEHRFSTFNKRKSDFSFVVVNDRHENEQGLRASWKTVDWKGVDLAFLNGDMVHAVRDEQLLFNVVIDPCADTFAAGTPLVYVRGNHETRHSLARGLLDYFSTDSGRYYYTLRQGSVAFLVLDCGEDKADDNEEYSGLAVFRPYMEQQAKWLANEIRSREFREAKFRVCLLHIPPSSTQNPKFIQPRWLWDNMVPLLNKAKLDLMLCGHTHRDAVREAGTDGVIFPIVIAGPQTTIRCDVSSDGIRIQRTNLEGETFPEIPRVKAVTKSNHKILERH